MTLEEELKDLKLNSIKHFIFYFYSGLFKNENGEIYNKSEYDLFKDKLDKILILDNNIEVRPITELINLSDLAAKIPLLDENIFILLTQQDNLPEGKFIYLFDKYYTYITNIHLITSYLNMFLIPTFVESIHDNIKNAFKQQVRYFYDHIQELKNHFENPVKKIESKKHNLYNPTYKEITKQRDEFVDFFKKNVILKNYNSVNDALFELKKKKENPQEKNKTRLYEFINHPDREVIEKIIVKNFNKESDKGIIIRYIIDSLESVKLLNYSKKANILRALKNSFEQHIGSRNGIFQFEYDSKTDIRFKETKAKLFNLIENIGLYN